MGNHVVFLVHGMGDFEKKWSEDVVTLLKTEYGKYDVASFLPFDSKFEFIEVLYNDKFEERRKQWKENSDAVTKVLIGNGLVDSAAAKLVKLGSLPAGDDNFFRTHVLDVIMYRFMPQIADQIKRIVQERILSRMSSDGENEPVIWSIIGHSLGTAVVHDTLNAMFTHTVGDVRLHHTRRPEAVIMVSNVSRVLWNDESIYTTEVVPHPDRTQGMCSTYLNLQHPLDPFPKVSQFHPPPAPWRNDGNRANYVCPKIEKDELTDWNVHDLAHYLVNPKVHVPIFRSLLWPDAIGSKEFKAQVKEYLKTRASNSKTIQNALEKFKVKNTAVNDWEEISAAISGFRQLVIGKGTKH